MIAELKTSTSTSRLRRLVLSDDARGVIRDLRCDIEPRMHAETGDLAWMGDWVGKLAGTTVRVAAFLHLVQCPDLSVTVIDRGTMEAAVDLARWAIPHAQIAIKMLGGNQSQADAHRLIAAIRKSGKHEVSERDMQRGTHLDADSVRGAVAMLVERGYLRQLPTPSARSGKRYEPYPLLVHSS